ncbi:terminase TerL endonuclease subunit [Heyndrickxia coagulans]|uniref:terminase TerL endonuclease subunit n=1 Tax=Heyndrickxia coagulans TaxID=1398 RepID=UPI0014529CAF|nr:terminase TerL endonuclease subunit [Heyndrickxia coagulans]MED4492821.1 terminase large subunit [Heyndrickxia coagulans]MED4535000.1 terminase large subunit [Heyndrickxia coagulans]QJE31811.1 terminase large subunit [Heyndrickxia coagulans]
MTYKNVLTYQTHPYIEEYFQLIESGKIPACKEQHQLVAYLKKVLSRDDIYIDEKMVENSVKIPARYFPYELYPWQKFANVFIFGVRWKDDDTLVFDRYFFYMGRGAGKNGFFSYDSFFMLSKQHGIPNYDIDIVATSEGQAKTSFKDVYDVLAMPENEKRLKNAFYRTKMLIVNRATKSEMRYNTSNARTKDGKRPGCVMFDEEHEYENYDAIKVFTSGGGKVKDYREFHFSTDGNVRGGPLDDLKEEARMVLNGEIEDISLFPFICKLDDPEEAKDPNLWAKANPSLPYNKTLKKKMLKEFSLAQRKPAIKIEFMTKRMNSPISDPRFEVATYEDRLATNQPIPPQLKGMDAIGGVDFADVRDFCSCGILMKYKGKRYWLQHTFIHHLALELQDINKDIVQLAVDKGLAEIVYGKSIPPEKIVGWYIKMAKKYYIKKICMDDYRASILGPKLEEAGFDVDIVRRGRVTHSRLSPIVDDCFINHTLVFGNDPLMRWYVGNVYVDFLDNDNKEYKKIDKEKRKTDGFFAFLHALNRDAELEDYGDLDLSSGGSGIKPIIV